MRSFFAPLVVPRPKAPGPRPQTPSPFGLLLITAGLIGSRRWFQVAIGGSMTLVVAVLVYSYVIWRDEQRGRA